MLIVTLIFASLAALIHLYIFVLESFWWTKESTRKTFGIDKKTAEITKPLALNQGFYNLFLAIAVIVGVIAYSFNQTIGYTLIITGTVSMLLASIVLVLSDQSKAKAAFTQGIVPLLTLICLLILVLY